MPIASASLRAVRGRVVMLVDNGVKGDSRVQKQAESAAASGWEVVLLGRSPDDQLHTWQIGQADVRLVPMPAVLSRHPHGSRRKRRRFPLAYAPTGIAAYRTDYVRAWRTDLDARRAATAFTPHATGTRFLHKLALSGEFAVAKLTGRWVAMRCRALSRANQEIDRFDGPWDRFMTRMWQRTLGHRAWRRFEPRLLDFELAFGRVVDSLKPDIIHANDFYMIGVGARAALRARTGGRPVKLVWDAHELVSGVKSRADNMRWAPAHVAHEREYARLADAAITVSDGLAEMLQQAHGLQVKPTVVLNAPKAELATGSADAPDLRELCGVGPRTPILVYSGAAAPQRGVDVMIEALPKLDGAHVALVVAQPPSKYIQGLVARARELGVADRVHVLPYVPHEQIVGYLSGADIGVIPIHHWPNHEIALITKFFEYAHARLPMIISDVRTMAETTRALGQGEVFRADDVEDFVRAAKLVLADPARYRAAYDRPGLLEGWTWEAQAAILDRVYSGLRPDLAQASRTARSAGADISVVVATRNSMPLLTKCIRSLLDQTLGLDRIEVIAVDAASHDGTAERIGSFVRKFPATFKMVRASHNDGDDALRNQGLELATGRYVVFLGPNEYLGREALERLVRVADENGSDVVLGKIVGLDGRRVPRDVFGRTDLDVEALDSPAVRELSSTKLFRRELVELHGLRFREDLSSGAEHLFSLSAYDAARRVSTLADYDYFYSRRAGDVIVDAEITQRLDSVEAVMTGAARLTGVALRGDAVAARHFALDVSAVLGPDLLTLDRASQESICDRVGRLADLYLTDEVLDRLDIGLRVRLTLARRRQVDRLMEAIAADQDVAQPSLVIEGAQVFVSQLGFRDDRFELPDAVFRVTTDVAGAVARRLEVRGAGWVRGGRRAALAVQIAANIQLSGLEASDIEFVVGDVTGEVAALASPDRRDGSVVRGMIPCQQLLAAVGTPDRKVRFPVRVRLRIHDSDAEVHVRVPETVRPAVRYVRVGTRMYRLTTSRNRHGRLMIDIVGVTFDRVAGKAWRTVRR